MKTKTYRRNISAARRLPFTLAACLLAVLAFGSGAAMAQCAPDLSPPEISCTDITVELDLSGAASLFSASALYSSAAITSIYDFCSGGTGYYPDNEEYFTIQASQAAFTCDDLDGPVAVTITVSDKAGNSASCASTVTVLDPLDACLIVVEGEGEVLPEGEGEVLPEGEGEVLPEGEGEVLPEGEGEVVVEGEGEVLPEGEGEVLPEGEGEVVVEGEGEVVVEGEGEVVIEGELPPLVDCPPDTIFDQPATSPEEDYGITFYPSDEGIDMLPWENLAVSESLYLQDTIHDVHWWGVESVVGDKAGVTTFIIEIADATYTPICSWTVEPTKTPANFYAYGLEMALPVYAYDVVVDPPCVLDGSPAFINIRGANLEMQTKQGSYGFGWVTTMSGDNAFWVDDNYSGMDALVVRDNLAFCLTSIPPVEGEGEFVIEGEGEVVIEGEGEVVIEGEGEVVVEGEGEVVEGEGEMPIEGEGEAVEGEVPAPALTITKTADTETFDTLGDVITYTITVTNSGNVVITDIEVTDPLTGLDASIASLAPGRSQTFTEEYTVTQEDVDAGIVVNVASVTGRAPDGSVLGDQDERDVADAKPPCCEGCDICDPGNIFLAALALLILLLASLCLTGGDIIAPINFKF